MTDEFLLRLRREPPTYLYRGQRITIFAAEPSRYVVHINGERLRARDPLPLVFVDYAYAKMAAEKAIDQKLQADARAAKKGLSS